MKKSKRKISLIIIHCSATPEGKHFTVENIDKWHKYRGFSSIGYHYVVYINGSINEGRNIDSIGAHCQGKNANSIGICYIGGVDYQNKAKDTRNDEQKKSLEILVNAALAIYPDAIIAGHYNFANKACPSFDVAQWLRSIGVKEDNIYK